MRDSEDISDSHQTESTIKLTPPEIEAVARYSVWRTDYYICTGIAYAKSIEKTAEDFMLFVGNTHSWVGMKPGLENPVQLLYFLIKNYKDGEFEIISESGGSVGMRLNRPYTSSFEDGPLLGVSLDEFEAFLWGHVAIMADRVGLDFVYRVEDNHIMATLSVKV